MSEVYWISAVSKTKFTSNAKVIDEKQSKATTAFPSAQGKGDFYQDNGLFSSRFSLTFQAFTLDDCEKLMDAIKEKGVSKVITPTSSIIKNVQITSFSKRKGFVNDVGRYNIEVEFGESINKQKEESTESYITKSNTNSEEATLVTAESFDENTKLDTVNQKEQQKRNFLGTLGKIKDTINSSVEEYITKLDTIVDYPVSTIIDVKKLMAQPNIVFNSTLERIQSYSTLLASVLELDIDYSKGQTQDMKNNNSVYVQSMGAMVLNATINNVVNFPYKDKNELNTVIGIVLSDYLTYRDRLDELQDNGFLQQDGATQQAISSLVYVSLGYAYQMAFALRTEYIYEVEDEGITIYDIAAEYYSEEWKEDEESAIDFIEETNDFDDYNGITFPKGSMIKVYV